MENINIPERKPFFSEEDIKKLGLTEEEAQGFEDAMAITETIELLPDDEDKFEAKFESTLPDDFSQGMDMFPELIKKDPEFVTQLFALYEVVGMVSEVPPPTVTKLSLDEIIDLEAKETVNDLLGTV